MPSMFEILASDYPILLTVVVALWLLVRQQRSVVRWMWHDQVAWARTASRLAIGALGLFLLWITVFDNWRQFLGYLVSKKNRWRSDPYLYEPPPDIVRYTSFVLLGLALLGAAYLFARYARGYWVPLLLAPLGGVIFYVLNSFRMRFELVGPLRDRVVDFSDPAEALMTFIWFGMF